MPERVIAIDGPSASGKSTVARQVAARLGRLYVDSGAVYRGVTWKALRDGVPTDNAERVAALLEGMDIRFFVAEGAVRFRIDGIEPGAELRTAALNEHVSKIAAMPAVRVKVVGWLREMTKLGALVMEGRDIGTAVFPQARFKFYLNASAEERARRRHAEIESGADKASMTAVKESLKRRDTIDSGRKMDPLRVAEGAEVIDSTAMGIAEVVELIAGRIKAEAKDGS